MRTTTRMNITVPIDLKDEIDDYNSTHPSDPILFAAVFAEALGRKLMARYINEPAKVCPIHKITYKGKCPKCEPDCFSNKRNADPKLLLSYREGERQA